MPMQRASCSLGSAGAASSPHRCHHERRVSPRVTTRHHGTTGEKTPPPRLALVSAQMLATLRLQETVCMASVECETRLVNASMSTLSELLIVFLPSQREKWISEAPKWAPR